MKSKLAIFGSCVSMDIFRSAYNEDYKDYFELYPVQLRLSLISIMQDAIDFSEDEIRIVPDTPQHRFSTNVLRNDLRKNFLSELNEDIDYLILDLYFDLIFGVLFTDKGIISNNNWDYLNTNFFKNLKEKKEVSFNVNPYEYYVLWTNCCDKFFTYLQENYPNLKVILNKVKIIDVIKDKNGDYYVEPLYTKRLLKFNPMIDMIEQYILSNFDVIFVDLTSDVTGDENHIWGKSLVHYNHEYYHNFFNVMQKIVNGNSDKYYFEMNNKIFSKKDIPKEYMHFNCKLRKVRNSNKELDKIMVFIRNFLK
ncbi:DUF6270 domain-containing protein [Methanosphaera sp. BMS]|uniref:DUF6270 domain-containing protein n=1 Tax=Methanosphaera sp. BMS TaxID=1789762 RepID=UPI000DC1BEF9|nr:DUF6270 domain-containing protein [Methanosphaera sp. BMS]AWX32293.1 hypothetical protein AW729_03865 [Methanosphaera sp. BMS]